MNDAMAEREYLTALIQADLLTDEQDRNEAQRMIDLCSLLCQVQALYDSAVANGQTVEQLRAEVKAQI